jgi:glycine hydroxymethyltransferase
VLFDTEKSTVTMGALEVTARGFREPEMKRIAEWIELISRDVENESLYRTVKDEVRELCREFPVYSDLD